MQLLRGNPRYVEEEKTLYFPYPVISWCWGIEYKALMIQTTHGWFRMTFPNMPDTTELDVSQIKPDTFDPHAVFTTYEGLTLTCENALADRGQGRMYRYHVDEHTCQLMN